MELALPMLTPERTLRFATLPSGEDPDSLVRKGGAAAFQAVLNAAQSPADALFGMLRGEVGDASAEQRAALRNRLVEAAGRIGDKALASEYRSTLLDRFFASRPRSGGGNRRGFEGNGGRFGNRMAPPMRVPRPIVQADTAAAERMRILVAILLRHPGLWHDLAHAFATLPLEPRLAQLRDAMEVLMETAGMPGETLDSAGLIAHLTTSGFDSDVARVLAEAPMPLPVGAASGTMPAEAESEWWHIFGFLNVAHLREEVALAEKEAARDLTPDTQRRHQALVEALWKVVRGEPDGAGSVDG
jgi:DNA primase